MIEDLDCQYGGRKSFYGKAKVEIAKNSNEEVYNLYSYGTLVARITLDFINKKEKDEYLGHYSCTTTRHQNEFFRQFSGLSTNKIKELYKKGIAEGDL